jgi:hypothetical protein
MNWILHPIKSFLEWKDRRYLKRKIKQAKECSLRENGKQYHVVMIQGTKKLEIVSNYSLKHNSVIKIDGIMRRYVSVYSTPADCFHKKIAEVKKHL